MQTVSFRNPFMIAGIAVIAVTATIGGLLLFTRGHSHDPSSSIRLDPMPDMLADEMTPVNNDSTDALLSVPLEQTVDERETIKKELLARHSFDLRDIFEKYIDRVGANGLETATQEAFPGCHDEAHDLGKVIFEKIGQIGPALKACNNACNSGCMHGVLMESFSTGAALPHTHDEGEDDDDHVSVQDVIEQAEVVCGDAELRQSYEKGDCLHGIGHALMFLSGYDVDTAMKNCRLLPTEAEAYYCATGGYMEYVNRYQARDAQTQSLFYPCATSDFPAACFRYKSTHVFFDNYKAGLPAITVIEQCLQLKGRYQVGCFHGVGNAHMGYIARGLLSINAICGFGDTDDQYACIEGAIERMARYYPEQAQKACQTLKDWKYDVCETGRKNQLYSLTKDMHLYL